MRAEMMKANERLLGFVCLGLLALQFGMQPLLYKSYSSSVEHPSTLIIVCEMMKCLIAVASLTITERIHTLWKTWRFTESIKSSGIPACTYALQNILVQMSYQKLPPLLFNLLNQTKIIWTALFVYIILGKSFSGMQCAAMLMLMIAAAILSFEQNEDQEKSVHDFSSDHIGVLCVIIASILSGIGSALTQRSVQARDAALVTIELSIYGTLFVLLHSALTLPNESYITFSGWQPQTLLPVLCNAIGGILVACLTKVAGGVLKSFALVGGIICTFTVESFMYDKNFSSSTFLAGFLVAFSLVLYSAFQPSAPAEKKKI